VNLGPEQLFLLIKNHVGIDHHLDEGVERDLWLPAKPGAGLGRIAKGEEVKRAEEDLVNFTDEAEQREGSADMNKKRDGLALK
jgi:hypothetical protein